MSLFEEIENAALDHIIDGDFRDVGVYRLNSNSDNDGFNAELEREASYVKQIQMAIAESNDAWIGTTRDTTLEVGDTIEWVNARDDIRRWTITGFEPTTNHTLAIMQKVRDEN